MTEPNTTHYLCVTFDDSLVGEIGEEMPFDVSNFEEGRRWLTFLSNSGIARDVTLHRGGGHYSLSELVKTTRRIIRARLSKAQDKVDDQHVKLSEVEWLVEHGRDQDVHTVS